NPPRKRPPDQEPAAQETFMRRLVAVVLALTVFAALAADKPEKDKDKDDYKKLEAKHLRNVKQLTFDDEFVRAGEAYFSPDAKKIILQAEQKGSENPFYQIYVMDLQTKKFRRVSTGIGKTTCSYFSPDGKKIIFASTHLDPDAKKHYETELKRREAEKKEKKRRYAWD